MSLVSPESYRCFSSQQPALFLFLVDQSAAMSDPFGNQRKMDFAALAINRCIYEIVARCSEGITIKNRCQIGVFGYGHGGASLLVGGWASEIDSMQHRTMSIPKKVPDGAGGLIETALRLRVYVEPKASGSQCVEHAFERAHDLIESAWLPQYKECFPVFVVNVTGSAPDDPSRAAIAAQELTASGRVLLIHSYLANQKDAPGKLFASLPAGEESDPCAMFLFENSSSIPRWTYPRAKNLGLDVDEGARGVLWNSDACAYVSLVWLSASDPLPWYVRVS